MNKYKNCQDGKCGATDCPSCSPQNFKGGIFYKDLLCTECGVNEKDENGEICQRCKDACPMCGNLIDEDTGICFTCKETVR